LNFGSPAAFQSLIQGNDEALLLGAKGAQEQAEEDVAGLSERPGGSIEDVMVTTWAMSHFTSYPWWGGGAVGGWQWRANAPRG
jgi:hypothetical protein